MSQEAERSRPLTEFEKAMIEAGDVDPDVRHAAIKVHDAMWAAKQIITRHLPAEVAERDAAAVIDVTAQVLDVMKEGSTMNGVKDAMGFVLNQLQQMKPPSTPGEEWKEGDSDGDDTH